jgi:hypothetical protein
MRMQISESRFTLQISAFSDGIQSEVRSPKSEVRSPKSEVWSDAFQSAI